jgi:photosystem II stability/assembly factor-like uncharacterized protein
MLTSGVDALFRSTDGGSHWTLAMDGLPLAPYIYSVVTDPFHPQRVYASLNSDGVFRSDDGGRHWGAVDNGLQIKGSDTPHPRCCSSETVRSGIQTGMESTPAS